MTTPLLATGCRAAADSLSGRAEAAAAALAAALQAAVDARPEERLWALTRWAEIAERRGDAAGAERAFRDALALGVADVYLQAAYADFLLDRGRAAEVLVLLKDGARADVLLLRLALAAKAAERPARSGLVTRPWRPLCRRARARRSHAREGRSPLRTRLAG